MIFDFSSIINGLTIQRINNFFHGLWIEKSIFFPPKELDGLINKKADTFSADAPLNSYHIASLFNSGIILFFLYFSLFLARSKDVGISIPWDSRFLMVFWYYESFWSGKVLKINLKSTYSWESYVSLSIPLILRSTQNSKTFYLLFSGVFQSWWLLFLFFEMLGYLVVN